MFTICPLNKKEKAVVLPHLFELLAENMNRIAPTGNSLEEDYQIWRSYIFSEIDNPEREILLIKLNDVIIGYFQYSLNDTTFAMEEIQIRQKYWGSGAFRELYHFLSVIVPENIATVKAYANKNNLKSQAILEHLGLKNIGENKNGNSYLYTGDCQELLSKYRNA